MSAPRPAAARHGSSRSAAGVIAGLALLCAALVLAALGRALWLAPVELVVWCDDSQPGTVLTVEVDSATRRMHMRHSPRPRLTPEPPRNHAIAAIEQHPSVSVPLCLCVSPRDGDAPVDAPHCSGPMRFVARLPDRFDALTIHSNRDGLSGGRVAVVWAGRWLFERPVNDGEWRAGVTLETRLTPWRLGSYVLQNAARIAGRFALFLLPCLLLGWPVLLLMGRWLHLAERFAAAAVCGWCVQTLASVALTHNHVSGTRAYWSVLACAAVATIALLTWPATRRRAGRLVVASRRQWAAVGGLALLSAFSVGVLFFPALSQPGWYMGHAYTDTCYNINTPEAFRHYALNLLDDPEWRWAMPMQHLVDGTVTPRIRSGDFLAVLNTAIASFTNARDVFAQQHINLWALVPFAAYGFLRRARASRVVVRLGTVLLSVSAIHFALFTQGYMSQYMLATCLLFSLHAGAALLSALRDPAAGAGRITGMHVWFALTLAGAIAVYPEQAFAPAGFAVYMLVWAAARRTWRPVWHLAAAGVLTTALANWSLAPVLHGATERTQYLDALDHIARHHVYTFYADIPRFLGVLFGVVDWVNLRPQLPGICDEVAGESGPALATILRRTTRAGPLIGLLMLAACAVALFRAGRGPRAQRLWLGVMLAFLGAAAVFAAVGRVYLYAKAMTTLGVLLMVGVVIGVDLFSRAGGVGRRRLAAAALCAMIAVNVLTTWIDNSVYLAARPHPAQQAGRTHIDVLRPELVQFDEAVRRLAEPLRRVYVVGHFEEGRGTDGDRVFRFHVQHTLRGAWVHWPDDPRAVIAPDARWVVVFDGFEHPALTDGKRVVFENALLKLVALDQ